MNTVNPGAHSIRASKHKGACSPEQTIKFSAPLNCVTFLNQPRGLMGMAKEAQTFQTTDVADYLGTKSQQLH